MSKLREMWRRIVDALYVDRYNCILCDAELHEETKYGICPTCMAKLKINDGNNICLSCGKGMRDEADYCLTCQNNNFEFDINRSYFVYEDDVKKLVYRLKFGGKKYMAKYLAMFYVDMYKKYQYNADVVVSVPISKTRKKERGYDQSREIAKVVAKELQLPYIDDAIVKIKDLRPQEELGAKERLTSVIGAFKLNNKEAIKGKRVLLIDDVLTTGATMSSVSHELRKKCSRVECLTLASPYVNYHTHSGNVLEDYEDNM